MTQIQLDKISVSVDELYALQKEIDSYINTQDAVERAYCEGCPEYEEIHLSCQKKALKMKQRIRGLAVSMGIHGEFLDEYMASCASHGLKVVAA